MLGLIQDYPLTVQHIFGRAEQLYPGREMVSRLPRGIERTTYGEWAQRTRRLATALQRLGVGKSDRVATFSWNHSRHVEAYFAAPCMGAVLHALNVRLSVDQLAYIIDHAEDQDRSGRPRRCSTRREGSDVHRPGRRPACARA